jgi:UDP-N-acetylmuramyl pentapeptide synthase
VLVLCADDPRTLALQHRLPAPDARIVTFGFSEGSDICAEHVSFITEEGGAGWPLGMTAKIVSEGTSVPVEVLGAVGAHAFLPALAAAAVGVALHKPLDTMVAALQSYKAPPGRMRLLPGIKNTLVIDDTYNASPAAAEAALETLNMVAPKGRKIAALGDMLELGRHSVEEHRKIGAHAARTVDILVTVGFRARDIAQGALDNGLPDGSILQFEDSGKAGKEIELMLQEGDCVLAKGSQSMRMERVVEEIMAEPERAAELLVRQDAEWKKR